jgi:pimeloyl-ACP methyl ester carboxylesterase
MDGGDTVWECVSRDVMSSYSFYTTGWTLVALGLLRCVLLFYCYCFSFHFNTRVRRTSLILTVVSALYCTVKLTLLLWVHPGANDPYAVLVGVSLGMVVLEYGLYLFVRRKEIALLEREQDGNGRSSSPLIPRLLFRQSRHSKVEKKTRGGVGEDGAVTSRNDVLVSVQHTQDASADTVISFSSGAHDGDGDAQSSRGPVHSSLLADEESKFIEIDSLRVHYKLLSSSLDEHGCYKRTQTEEAEEKECAQLGLVLLHGFGESLHAFDSVAQALLAVPEIAYVLMFDRPGLGLTSRVLKDQMSSSSGKDTFGVFEYVDERGFNIYKKQENPYTDAYSMFILKQLITRLTLTRRHVVVGHGLGANVAVQFANAQPELVESLVLIAPSLFTSSFPQLIRTFFKTKLGQEAIARLVTSELGEVCLRRSYMSDTIPDQTLRRYEQIVKQPQFMESLRLFAAAVGNNLADRDLTTELGYLSCPVLFMHGDSDNIISLGESHKAHSTLKKIAQQRSALEPAAQSRLSSELLVLPEVGHAVTQEFPDTVVSCIKQFMQRSI